MLNKQLDCWWFETPWHPCVVIVVNCFTDVYQNSCTLLFCIVLGLYYQLFKDSCDKVTNILEGYMIAPLNGGFAELPFVQGSVIISNGFMYIYSYLLMP